MTIGTPHMIGLTVLPMTFATMGHTVDSGTNSTTGSDVVTVPVGPTTVRTTHACHNSATKEKFVVQATPGGTQTTAKTGNAISDNGTFKTRAFTAGYMADESA